MTRIARLVILMAMVLLPFGDASAFWSLFFADTIHQTITTTAMSRSYTFAGNPYRFSGIAIDSTNQWHATLDNPLGAYDARDHFDSETLQDAYTLIADRRLQLMDELAKSSPDSSVAWQKLGEIFHAIQDFYSHSTWVARGNTGIANFGADTASVDTTLTAFLPPSYLLSAAQISLLGNVCLPDTNGVELNPKNTAISSGYYDVSPLPAGKCQHGSPSAMYLNCSIFLPDGINHDAPCFAESADQLTYETANFLAELETEAFISSIVNALNAENSDAGKMGFCVLFGIDPSDPTAPCYSPTSTVPPVNFPASFPKTIYETEGPFAGVWRWNGSLYEATWDNGAVADIIVYSFTGASVVFLRTDTANSVSSGLTATYTGDISPAGNSITNSNVTFSWPGVPGYPASEQWYASW